MKMIKLIESRKKVFFVTADTTVHEAARLLSVPKPWKPGMRLRLPT